MSREAMKQPEALRLADALDDEFTRGRISNHNGRKAAVELRRLHDAVVADSDKVYALLRQALEALESDPISHAGLVSRKQAITVLRQALVDVDDMSRKRVEEKAKREHEWVGLTDAEKSGFIDAVLKDGDYGIFGLLKAIEAKLKEKNT